MAEIPPVDLRSTCAYLLRMKVLGQKQAVNRSVDAQLLKEARDDGVNLSSVLELALAQERARRWLAEKNPQLKPAIVALTNTAYGLTDGADGSPPARHLPRQVSDFLPNLGTVASLALLKSAPHVAGGRPAFRIPCRDRLDFFRLLRRSLIP